MTIKYQAAKTGTGNFGLYLGLEATMDFLKLKVPTTTGVRLIKGAGNDPGPLRTRFEGFKRVRAYLLNGSPGDRVTILPEVEGNHAWTVRVADYDPTPESFFVGTPGVDRIANDVFGRFNDRYGITNLGICANKPGEHGICNAIDFGVSRPVSADDIHAAILDVGNYLRNRMLADMEGEPGLPVNGAIVMQQICSREDRAWHFYGGVPHVTHVHCSAWPNPLPGWV